jgi:hypothetical protein
MSSKNRADRKAHIAAAHASARRHPNPVLVDEPPDMPGWHTWKVGAVLVVMPKLLLKTLSLGAPCLLAADRGQRNGECPRCDTVTTDPIAGHASLSHDDDCPVRRLESALQWIDPRARP